MLCLDRGVAKDPWIELPDGPRVRIVHEDRSVLVLDKPAGWLVAPEDWEQTSRNLSRALRAGVDAGDWWARSRNLRFLRPVHRLDAETTGLLMLVKHEGAMAAYSRLFAGRAIEKRYLAVVEGTTPSTAWTREDPLGPEAGWPGRQRVDWREGKPAVTAFRVVAAGATRVLVEALPRTGRTHQIRLHLAASGCPVVGDALYGRPDPEGLALRAVGLRYLDPFRKRPVVIEAEAGAFRQRFGWGPADASPSPGPIIRELPSSVPHGGPGRGTVRRPSARSGARSPSAGETGQAS